MSVQCLKRVKKDDPSNYRPISLTSVTSKLLEKIVSNHLTKHLNDNNLLNDNQHGFRKKRSCETQLLDAIHDWSSTLESGSSVHIAFLDLSKAFDTVSHILLREKLKSLCLGDRNLKWIMNFLKARTQRVTLNGEFSNWSVVKSGAPQGTILGPILCNCFINDITKDVQSTIRLYADDCIVYRPIKSIEDCNILQDDLKVLGDWSKMWLLDFNIAKCKIMKMTKKRNPIDYVLFPTGPETAGDGSRKIPGSDDKQAIKLE